jgi:hypothetical protein
MKVLLVDASRPTRKGHGWYYNLGLAKAANWWRSQGAEVQTISPPVTMFDTVGVDVAFVSAIFSWNVLSALSIANGLRSAGIRVEVGGPGFFALKDLASSWHFTPQVAVDPRFDGAPGSYEAVFWSRGCPAYNCTLGYPKDGSRAICLVPEMEGSRSTLHRDVTPAPIILDNNLSALPRTHQELIVERTLAAGFPKVDCNSGFEPHSFRKETAELWAELPLVAWRFAYDELRERKAVLRTIEILDSIGVKRRDLHIYCLAGNETVEACEERVLEIRRWKCVPVVQRRRPLDWTGGALPTLHDWTEQSLIDFQRWGNRLSYAMPYSEYDRTLNHSGLKARKHMKEA